MDNNNRLRSETEVTLLDYLLLLLEHGRFIVKTTFAVTCLAALITLVLPKVYLAETKILPPHSASSSLSLAFVSQMGGIGASPLGMKTPNDFYIALLKTRSVADYVADKLELGKIYPVKSKDRMRDTLSPNLTISDDRRSGIVTIGYMYGNPQKAADIANAYVEGLQNLSNKLAITEAARRRFFFEEQLKSAKENLIRSEEALKNFQQRTGTIKIDDESKAILETMVRLRASISAKEVQLRVMKSYATTQNPDIQRLQEEAAALKEELLRLESKAHLADDVLPNVGKMSSLGIEYVRKMREFRYNETLYEILMKQFEAAKLDESKDAALIQVVESAAAPEHRLKPKRKVIVIKTFLFTLFFSIVLVFLKSYCQSLLVDPEAKAKVQQMAGYLDFTRLVESLNPGGIVKKAGNLVSKLRMK